MIFKVWGKEVDLDFADEESFLSDEELKSEEELISDCQHDWIKSTYKDKWLHTRKFLPPSSEPKAIIVYCHGIQAHSGKNLVVNGRKLCMPLLCDHFVQKRGFALYAIDLLGHGFSEGDRTYLPDFRVSIDDFNAFAHKARSEHPDIPIFLMGHSYGANVCLHVAQEHWQDEPKLGGLMLMATATRGDMPPAIVVFLLAGVLAKCFPKSTPVFMPNPISSDRVWKDESVLEIMTRPVNRKLDSSGTPFRLGTAAELIKAMNSVRANTIPELKVPFVAVHGTDDFGVPMSDVDFLEENAATPKEDQTVVRIEGAYHDLLADPAAEETVEHLDKFAMKRMEILSS